MDARPGADAFLATMDGILKLAVSNIVDDAGNPLSKDLLRDMLKTLPSEHLRDKKAMRFLLVVMLQPWFGGSVCRPRRCGCA